MNKIKLFIIITGIISFLIIGFNHGYCQSYPYDRSAAIAYADSYWSWPNYNRSKYWLKTYFEGDTLKHASDCANFAMQCLVAGGRDPYDPFYNKKPLHISGYEPSYYFCTATLAPYLRTISTETQGDPTNVEAGDIILMKHEATDTDFYHAVVIVEVDGENIYYTAHTTDRQHHLLSNPTNQRFHYFHILDGYLFWSDWGCGYYWYFFSWLGPEEIFTAAGVNPQTNIEYCGFNQFIISGIPSNSNIIHSHLRLTVNSHSGTLPLELNINHITNTNIPSPQECLSPPYYIQGEEVNVSTGGTIWFDMSNTNAPTHIMEANNGNHMFGIGLSDNDTYTKSHYKFYGYSEDLVVDTKLKVFVDDSGERNYQKIYNPTVIEEVYTEAQLFVKDNLVSHNAEISFSSSEENEAIIKIYDIGGRHIRTWIAINSHVVNRIQWDLRDNLGNRCPRGIYFVRLTTPTTTMTEKLEILR